MSLAGLKPSEEIQVSAITLAAVYAVFQFNAPNLSDVKASPPGGGASMNTHKSVKTAVITAAAVVGALAFLGKSPTVWIVGGAAITVEAWKYNHANMTDNLGNVVAPGASMTGQPSPTLNAGS